MGARPLVDPSGIAHTSSTLALLFRLLLPLFSVTCDHSQSVVYMSQKMCYSCIIFQKNEWACWNDTPTYPVSQISHHVPSQPSLLR